MNSNEELVNKTLTGNFKTGDILCAVINKIGAFYIYGEDSQWHKLLDDRYTYLSID